MTDLEVRAPSFLDGFVVGVRPLCHLESCTTALFFNPTPQPNQKQPVVPLIQRNIDLNIPPAAGSSSSNGAAAAVAAAYAWGGSKAALGADAFDAILMADVVYDPKYYSALVTALRDLSHWDTVVTLAHRERHPDAALFFLVGR